MPNRKSRDSLRAERDTFGTVEVPSDVYFGAETGRCLINFQFAELEERMPVSELQLD